MTLFDRIKAIRDISGENHWTRRFSAEMTYMSTLSSTKNGEYDARIAEAADYVLSKKAENGAVTKADVLEAEKMLEDLSAEAKKLKVICAAHAHIDMNWMWGYQETAAVTVDTFRTMLDLMNEYPEYKFSQSQASTYKIIEDNAPEMLDEIKKRIHEGRWELTASTWVETDKNMPNGESLSRHILYTKKYLSKLFDIDPDSLRIDFEPDTFGHNIATPEICQNGGVDYYYHCRGNEAQQDVYLWRAKSGKEILVFRDPHFYCNGVGEGSFDNIPLFCRKNGVDTFLYVYGVGDHGGGPTRCDINAIIDDAAFPLYPTIKFGTFAEFFAEMERFRSTLPVVDHELNYIFTGCYTTQTRIKMANRIAEDRAYDSEMLSAAANVLTGAHSKTAIYEKAWRDILFNHFHDILPGSGVILTREYALGKFQEALAAINTNANTAMRDIADAIDTSSIKFDEDLGTRSQGGGVGFMDSGKGWRFPQTERGRGSVRAIHLFNSTMYNRHEAVEVVVWDYNYDLGRAYFTDSEGNEVRSEVCEGGNGYWGHTYTRFVIDAKIPALGYATYILKLREYDSIGNLTNAYVPSDNRQDHIADTPCVLENSKIKAVFDPHTFVITELTDKETGRTIADSEHPTAIFRYIIENPRFGMTSWRVGPYMNITNLNRDGNTVRLTDYGITGMRRWLRYKIGFSKSNINVLVELKGESSTLSFHVDVDWHEVGNGNGIPQLNFYLPVTYKAEKFTYDIPLGTIERGDIPHDVPGNSFMRIGDEDRAAYIVTETKYGFRGHDNAGALTLIRSSYDPDPYPELGQHQINFGVGICSSAEQKREAFTFCHPVSFNSDLGHKGTLPLTGSLVKIDGDIAETVMLSGIKNAENGGLVVRLSEIGGNGGKVKLTISSLARAPKTAALVDITEQHEYAKCDIDGHTVSFEMKPYTMATVLIKE